MNTAHTCRFQADADYGMKDAYLTQPSDKTRLVCPFSGHPCVTRGCAGIHLATHAEGFELFGSSPDSCEFVLNIPEGIIDKGVRFLSASEVTEPLLSNVEARFDLTVT